MYIPLYKCMASNQWLDRWHDARNIFTRFSHAINSSTWFYTDTISDSLTHLPSLSSALIHSCKKNSNNRHRNDSRQSSYLNSIHCRSDFPCANDDVNSYSSTTIHCRLYAFVRGSSFNSNSLLVQLIWQIWGSGVFILKTARKWERLNWSILPIYLYSTNILALIANNFVWFFSSPMKWEWEWRSSVDTR